MGNFDCMFDEETQKAIFDKVRLLRLKRDREEFRDEVNSELYDFMPFERAEINRIIERVFRKYKE